jgi:ABC-type multidrug transport system ATPase subunit/pSer/pThr/pTyr-binding forkhead associated (FHA) protein/ABC-type multidrug transport system permease subunit
MSELKRSFKIGIISNFELVKKVAFTKDVQSVLVLGKSPECDLIMLEGEISRQHAQIIHNSNNELYIVDLGSTNGTFVNGRKLEPGVPYQININDEISFSSSLGNRITFDPDNFTSKRAINQSKNESSDFREILGTTDILDKLNRKPKITIGRSTECDVVLPGQSSISRKHAVIEKRGKRFFLTDLGSMNGTFLNGKRIDGSVEVRETDAIYIGRYLFKLKGRARDIAQNISIRAEFISKQFSDGKMGLHECSFDIPAQSLTAVMGPSGCGKTTLLKVLNGETPSTEGRVLISGLDLDENYDYVKTLIGYVPQDDIIHRELTVDQTLYYAARLRMGQVDPELMANKIEQVLSALKIVDHRSKPVSKISGGQRKRVSIAVEILTDPLILFLDEPTSPLDPQTIEEFLSILKDLSLNGTTVVMVTHKPEDLLYMDSVIFMAEGGFLVYQGNSMDYLSYFKSKDIVNVYAELAKPKAKKWIEKRPVANTLKKAKTSFPKRGKGNVNFVQQFWWLTIRNFNIKLNDKVNTSILLLQAPIIAALIGLIFEEIVLAVPFLMAVSSVWFGTNNAAREIVSESTIYRRERMFNQGIVPYILSKITVLTCFSAVQSFLFIGIIFFRFKGNDLAWNNFALTFLWMLLLSISSTLLGLLLSAIVSTSEKVMSLVPIILIPQIMLAGIVTKIKLPIVEWLSYLTLSRWGTEGFGLIQEQIIAPTPTQKEPEASGTWSAKEALIKQFHDKYDNYFGSLHATLKLDILVVIFMSTLFFVLIYLIMKNKDTMKIN